MASAFETQVRQKLLCTHVLPKAGPLSTLTGNLGHVRARPASGRRPALRRAGGRRGRLEGALAGGRGALPLPEVGGGANGAVVARGPRTSGGRHGVLVSCALRNIRPHWMHSGVVCPGAVRVRPVRWVACAREAPPPAHWVARASVRVGALAPARLRRPRPAVRGLRLGIRRILRIPSVLRII